MEPNTRPVGGGLSESAQLAANPMYKTPEISREEITGNMVLLGEGSFGKVYRAKCRGKDVAVKMLHRPIVDEKMLMEFKKEVDTMSSFQHPNICLFMGACTQPGNFFIVSEYLAGGDFEKLLKKKTRVSLYRRLLMAKDAAMGINWLHCSNPSFIHRDLKSSNLLIDENFRVKVCDFGLSEAKSSGQMLQDSEKAMGTPLWMAPEVMRFEPFNEKVDVYSFGIVLWEIITGQQPFPHHNSFRGFRDAVCVKHERPPIPASLEPLLVNLIQMCWHPLPAQRPDFSLILTELDHCLVHVAMNDELGRSFWKHFFLEKQDIPWDTFAPPFLEALQHPLNSFSMTGSESERERVRVNIECLKTLVTKKDSGGEELVVNAELFGNALEWFGPITHPEQTGPNDTILDHMSTVMREPWFHGALTESAAKGRLSGKKGGTFLVRFSSQRGSYTISQISNQRQVRHWRITHQIGGRFILDGAQYDSLHELLADKGFLNPRKAEPCDGSDYGAIFKPPSEGGGYMNDDQDESQDRDMVDPFGF